MIDLRCGDCLELMKDIPDGSVDLILCDLPYGTIKGASLDGWKNQTTYWDNIIDTKRLFCEYERILRMNGIAILFSQEPYTSHLRTFKSENLIFCYPLIWKKRPFCKCFTCKKSTCIIF
jgi:site-specific DNA-methyltransferase (adenine-specific)